MRRLDDVEWRLDCLQARMDALAYKALMWDETGRRQVFEDKRKAQKALVKAAERLAERGSHLPLAKAFVLAAKAWDGSSLFDQGLVGYGNLRAFEEK